MTLLKKLMLAASVLWLTSTANAADLGDFGDVSGLSVFGVNNFVVGGFEDTASFELSSAATFDSVVYNFSFATSAAIEDFTISLTSGLGELFTYTFADVVTEIPFTLGAGTYDVSITGNAITAGTYSLSISPVPEASTYALLLSGLGFVSLVARRRLKK